MSEDAPPPDDPRVVKRALVTSVAWQGGLIATAIVLGALFVRARPSQWPTLISFSAALLPLVTSFVASSWRLARRNYATVGPAGASIRRMRRGNIAFTAILAALAGFVYWSPVFKPYVSSYSRADYDKAMRELEQARGGHQRFYALNDAAKTSVFFGTLDDAAKYALELLDTADHMEFDWNLGNAIHDGHAVLGLVALREGRLPDAKEELLLATRTSGSPQLDTFGPNMMLAKELLERGEDATVLRYFEACGRFWEHPETLAAWSADVRAGRMPDFGANLIRTEVRADVCVDPEW